MALERCTQTPHFIDTAGGHERLGAMPMDALPAHPLASGEAAHSPPEGGALGNTAKSVRQTQSEKERVRHLQTHFGKTAAQEKESKDQAPAGGGSPFAILTDCPMSVVGRIEFKRR